MSALSDDKADLKTLCRWMQSCAVEPVVNKADKDKMLNLIFLISSAALSGQERKELLDGRSQLFDDIPQWVIEYRERMRKLYAEKEDLDAGKKVDS